VRTEFESVDFGDKRLNKRSIKILEKSFGQPQSSIPQAMGSWADTKAAYRFISNPKVTPEKILEPHQKTTLSRIQEHQVILAVQDTTELNYTAHKSFHKILKSGCKIEKRQQQTAERLRTCLALDSIVAWRIQLLTMLGREAPDLSCDVMFEDYEWKALYCYVHQTTEPPAEPPSLNEAVLLVARVGGFLARKSDGFPGTTVLWRGLQQLSTISFAWFAFGPGRPPP
jgi:hypothetical protein